jgi:hypothetical protein
MFKVVIAILQEHLSAFAAENMHARLDKTVSDQNIHSSHPPELIKTSIMICIGYDPVRGHSEVIQLSKNSESRVFGGTKRSIKECSTKSHKPMVLWIFVLHSFILS